MHDVCCIYWQARSNELITCMGERRREEREIELSNSWEYSTATIQTAMLPSLINLPALFHTWGERGQVGGGTATLQNMHNSSVILRNLREISYRAHSTEGLSSFNGKIRVLTATMSQGPSLDFGSLDFRARGHYKLLLQTRLRIACCSIILRVRIMSLGPKTWMSFLNMFIS